MKRLKELWEKICFEIKMRDMDAQCRDMCGSCFGMYPPLFYYRHTPEEIKEISERDVKRLREMIAELDN